MKKCPLCLAEIPTEARKCRYCGEWVDHRAPYLTHKQKAAAAAKIPATVHCPACGQKALPMQTRCLHCHAPLDEGIADPQTPSTAIQPPPTPGGAPAGFEACPGCGALLQTGAVLCIQCGFDIRTGKRRKTHVHRASEGVSAPRKGPLPAGFAKVGLGLGFHYASLLVLALGEVAGIGLTLYAITQPNRLGILTVISFAAVLGLLGLQVLLRTAGSILCLWVPGEARARRFIVASLVLDILRGPLAAYLVWAELPLLIASVVGLVSWALFMFFLRRVADHLDLSSEVREAGALLITGVILLVTTPLLLIGLGYLAWAPGFLGCLTGLIAIAGVVILLGFVIKWFHAMLSLISLLRETIRLRLHG